MFYFFFQKNKFTQVENIVGANYFASTSSTDVKVCQINNIFNITIISNYLYHTKCFIFFFQKNKSTQVENSVGTNYSDSTSSTVVKVCQIINVFNKLLLLLTIYF